MRELKLGVLFTAIAVLLYANSITGDYLMDDTFLIRDNHYLDSLSHFISFFTSGTVSFGRPVRYLSFYIDTALFGKSPIGYHVSNVLYYLASCMLVYRLSLLLFNNTSFAVVVTLLFLAHPLHTEGVAYLSGRKDILGVIFTLASLISFIHYLDTHERRYGLLFSLFFLLALNSKETYAIAPLLFGAVAWYRGENVRQYWHAFGILLAVAFLFLLYVVFFRNRVLFDYLHTLPVYGNNQGINLPTAMRICGQILYLAFIPFSLSADYSYNAIKRVEFSDLSFFPAVLLLILCAGAAFYCRRSHRALSLSLMWMLICLIPVCQAIPYPEIISERSLILLTVGSCFIFTLLLFRLPRRLGAAVFMVVLVSFSAATISRNRVWHDSLSLWTATVQAQPDCARARYNLGCALAQQGEYLQAAEQLVESLKINPPDLITVPDYSLDALLNLGNVYAFLRDYEQAKRCYREVLHHNPEHMLAGKNLRIVERMEQAK